jgi:tetratricopeptide (TPR) repeat protein
MNPIHQRWIAPWALVALSAVLAAGGQARAGGFEQELAEVQRAWAVANYNTPDAQQRAQAFETLSQRAAALAARYPSRAEPLVWEGIVLSTYAGVKGGLGALGLVRRAREKLEAAERIDPAALDGSVYTSLGALYYKVPGWPLGFGDSDRARAYLEKALAINPDGIDPNFFFGEYLAEQGEYRQARLYLEKALRAPPRPNRELADSGRKREVRALLDKIGPRS